MNFNKSDKLFKSWSSINDEVALIKDVVSKGEHIDLCMQYLSHKRKIPIIEYECRFKQIIDKYIQELLSGKLISKAETILINMQRNVNCVLFQFIQESNEDTKEYILNHLLQKGIQHNELKELQFFWDVLQQIKSIEKLQAYIKQYINYVSLESFMQLDFVIQQRLLIELHYAGCTLPVINNISDKRTVWDYLLETENIREIIRWCTIQRNLRYDRKYTTTTNEKWLLKYSQWSIEKEMFEKGVETLSSNADDCLRNCLTAAGYIFNDEVNDPKIVLRRICITNSYTENASYIKGLRLGKIFWENEFHYILLQNFISLEEITNLPDLASEELHNLADLIICLKKYSVECSIHDFIEITKNVQTYLENTLNLDEMSIKLLKSLNNISILNETSTISSSSKDEIKTYSTIQWSFTCNCNHFQKQKEIYFIPHALLKSSHGLDLKLLRENTNVSEISQQNDHHQKESMKVHYLNYLHYIKQSRSAYAVYTFIINHLNNYGLITKAHLWAACQKVYSLCIKMASDDETIIHSIAFCEMLGFDTQCLRCLLKLGRTLNIQYVQMTTLINVITHAERDIVEKISKHKNTTFPLSDFKAIMIIKSTIFDMINSDSCWDKCSDILQYYSNVNDFWHILVLVQYFEIPLNEIKLLCNSFKAKMLSDNLIRSLSNCAFIYDARQQKRPSVNSQKIKKEFLTSTTSIETIASFGLMHNELSIETSLSNSKNNHCAGNLTINTPDIFALILLNNNHTILNETFLDIETFFECFQKCEHTSSHDGSTSRSSLINFLQYSVDHQMPVLGVLAATINPLLCMHIKWCWLVWLSITTRQWQDIISLAITDKQNFPWNLMELIVQQGQLKALVRSFYIFYPDNSIVHLFRFLDLTRKLQFDDSVIHELRLYGLALTNDQIQIPFISLPKRRKLMMQSIRFLLLHLKHNFHSAIDEQEFLACICKSGLSDVTGQLDFCLLAEFHKILNFNEANRKMKLEFDFIDLIENGECTNCTEKYEHILNSAVNAKEYDVAIGLAMLLQKPVGNIIYGKWIDSLEIQLQTMDPKEKWDEFLAQLNQYEEDILKYSLPPETLVNFLLHATSLLPVKAFRQRYLLLQKSLNIIKYHHLFPNESFDRDDIEYNMILSNISLTSEKDIDSLPIYNSEYYEQIMIPERRVLYKSFWELKELAGIDDINIYNKLDLNNQQYQQLENVILRLLDEGDIVEALRLQELFQVRPLDLRLVVFCMALAEGLSTVRNMSSDELQLFATFENAAFLKLNKRTLTITPNDILIKKNPTLSTNEMPYKEKQQTLAVLQGIASKIKYGLMLAKRIICTFRAAMHLNKEYVDILRTKDMNILLQSVAKDDCSHSLLVVSDILSSMQAEPQEIAELLAYEITIAVIRPCFYIFNNDHSSKSSFAYNSAKLWGYDINRDLHLFLELTPDRIKLGTCLLEYCDALNMYRQYRDDKSFIGNIYFQRLIDIIMKYSLPSNTNNFPNIMQSNILPSRQEQTTDTTQILSHKKQNIIYIELLIKAHQCFVHECSMEGIANVLKRAKALNSVLTKAKSWRLIVRLLTGIARYREMSYCFDALILNEQFESLLGHFDDDKSHGLRQAILAYLREYSPPEHGKELFKLSALHFLMYKELAEFWQQDAQTILMEVYSTAFLQQDNDCGGREVMKLYVNENLIASLNRCLEYYIHATENYILDNKFLAAQNCAVQAELVALQIDLAQVPLNATSYTEVKICDCVICLTSRDHFKDFVIHKLSVSQSLILSRVYNYDINWSEVILQQFIIKLKRSYLQEFLMYIDISDDLIENTSKSFHMYSQRHQTNEEMELHLMQLIDLVQSVTLKYKLASMIVSGKTAVLGLINDHRIHYLRDVSFGRHDENRIK